MEKKEEESSDDEKKDLTVGQLMGFDENKID